MLGLLIFALLQVASPTASPAMDDGALAPVPPEIAERLPRFCRYDVDLTAVSHPHAVVLAHTQEGDGVCPFAAGGSEPVHIFKPRGPNGCDQAQLDDLKVVAVQALDGRAYRRQTQCVWDPVLGLSVPAGLAGGRAYVLTFDEASASLPDKVRFHGYRDASRLGAPFVAIAGGDRFMPRQFGRGITYKCVLMLPEANVDALGFFKEAGRPMPASVTEEDVTGRDCGEVIRQKVGPRGSSEGWAMPAAARRHGDDKFKLWFYATRQTPAGAPLVRRIRTTLANVGATAAKDPHHVAFSVGTIRVFTARDGGQLALVGSPEGPQVDLRALSPGTCDLLYAIASDAGLYAQTMQTDAMTLRPSALHDEPLDLSAKEAIAVTSGADLCALLRPGFDEWRAETPHLPTDLRDLEGVKETFMIFVTSPTPPSQRATRSNGVPVP